ncbi:NAD(P)H-dependent oxidoreductase [Sphingomonas sp. PB2P19]|uniref:NAD(P)H-dependent oxidoreductase n=1 Tax=Sphingomonas rhamnosi TaxID=3096156 RepID=UPI002FCB462B
MTEISATARAAPDTTPPVHLVVSANPAPDGFDHAIVEAYRTTATEHGHTVVVRDLYVQDFDPVLKLDERPGHGSGATRADVVDELRYVREAAAIVLVYPIWYGFPPAMLKGYVDRVLGSGYSFRDFHDQKGQATLAGKLLVSFSTSGLPLAWLSEKGQVLSLREIFDVYLWRGFGMKQSEHVMIESVVPNMSSAYAAEQLERVRHTTKRTCALLDDTLVYDSYEY